MRHVITEIGYNLGVFGIAFLTCMVAQHGGAHFTLDWSCIIQGLVATGLFQGGSARTSPWAKPAISR